MKKTNTIVAIFGATSHIAKGLIFFLKNDESFKLHCYARNLEKVSGFCKLIDYENPILKSFSEFNDDRIDIIINCIGISYTSNLVPLNENVFELTENFDTLILDYIRKNPEATYINCSSGAVYGTSFNKPASLTTIAGIDVNNILITDYYRIAKLNSEAKHRSFIYNNIIDLRIFGYYSRFIDLEKKYLLTDIITCITEKKILKTSSNNIIRDYVHPIDLSNLVKACFGLKNANKALDVKSKQPISKMEILRYFNHNHGLMYEIIEDYKEQSQTGEKQNYYSEYHNIEAINFKSKYSSIECISAETEAFFKLNS